MRIGLSCLLLGIAAAASAQTPEAGARRPPAEIGVGLSGAGSMLGDGAERFTGAYPELRLTLPYTPRFSFEIVLLASAGGPASPHGLYLLQVKQTERGRHRSFRGFVTYGLAGTFHQTGAGTRARAEIIPPVLGVGGFGFERDLGARAALRADMQGFAFLYHPAGARFSTGLSVAIGRLSRQ
jgi:hypothetical protein